MLPNRAANLPIDLSLDEDYNVSENEDLKEFYESNLSLLFDCSMKLIGYKILEKIAVLIKETSNVHEEWRKYAEEMGLDNYTIAEVKASASCNKQLELLIAMDSKVRQYGTFGNIIQALLNTKHFYSLKEIKPFVENLLPKIPPKKVSNSTSSRTTNKESCTEEVSFVKSSSSFSNQKWEHDSYQQHSINIHFKNNLQISDSLPRGSLGEIKVPSAPEDEKIKILIPHAESENSDAEKLSTELNKGGAIATTLSQVNNWINYGPEIILNRVFREVDFIVPILSSRLIEEMHSKIGDEYHESVYAQNNRRLYTLIMEEYSHNKCVNYRVRPVIVPKMKRSLVCETVFKFSFRLWEEVPKLIRVLKETKYINAL